MTTNTLRLGAVASASVLGPGLMWISVIRPPHRRHRHVRATASRVRQESPRRRPALLCVRHEHLRPDGPLPSFARKASVWTGDPIATALDEQRVWWSATSVIPHPRRERA